MEQRTRDMNRELMVDGNGVAGALYDLFQAELTACPAECAHCGHLAPVGELLAFTQAPGIILRCPTCENIMLRLVTTRDAYYLDARGAAYLRLARTSY